MSHIKSYFALFNEENGMFNIWFPDLDGCYSCAEKLDDVAAQAKEALELWLFGLEEDGLLPAKASKLSELQIEQGEAPLLVTVNLKVVREQQNNKAIKKTITLPAWLNSKAEEVGVNFSQTLQEALKEKLAL